VYGNSVKVVCCTLWPSGQEDTLVVQYHDFYVWKPVGFKERTEVFCDENCLRFGGEAHAVKTEPRLFLGNQLKNVIPNYHKYLPCICMQIHAPIPEKAFILITFRPCDAASIFKNLRIDAP